MIIDLPSPPFAGAHAASASGGPQSMTASEQTWNGSPPASVESIAEILSRPLPPAPIIRARAPKTPEYEKKLRQEAADGKREAAAKRGGKRKRGKNNDDDVVKAAAASSDEADVAPGATKTRSGRQVNRPAAYAAPEAPPQLTAKPSKKRAAAAPAKKRKRATRKKEANITCTHCQRGHSPLNNQIVFCDECNRPWHQLCHDPRIDEEVVTIVEKEWFCHECKPVEVQPTHPTVLRSEPTKNKSPEPAVHHLLPESQVEVQPTNSTVPRSEPTKNKSPQPVVHHPLPESQTEVPGGGFSTDERRRYLSSLSHATLVELLVTVSDNNPSIPMFPANLKSMPSSEFAYKPNVPTSDATKSADTPAPAEPASQPKAKPAAKKETKKEPTNGKRKAKTDAAPSPRKRRREDSPESEYEEFEEHRLYPRTGNAFQLPQKEEDLDVLREDPDCPTFSYSLHGPAKERAEANEPAPVCDNAP